MDEQLKALTAIKTEMFAKVNEREAAVKNEPNLTITTTKGIEFQIPTLRLKAAIMQLDSCIMSLNHFQAGK